MAKSLVRIATCVRKNRAHALLSTSDDATPAFCSFSNGNVMLAESDAMQNVGGVLNERVASRLSIQPPSAYLVQTYLEKIGMYGKTCMSL